MQLYLPRAIILFGILLVVQLFGVDKFYLLAVSSDRGNSFVNDGVLAQSDVSIKVSLEGKIENVLVEEGDIVHKGQLLLVLEHDNFLKEYLRNKSLLKGERSSSIRSSILDSIRDNIRKMQFAHIRSSSFGIIKQILVEPDSEIKDGALAIVIAPLNYSEQIYLQNKLNIDEILVAGDDRAIPKPEVLKREKIEFPDIVFKAQLNGKIQFEMIINKTGDVVWIKETSVMPEGLGLAEAVLKSIKEWKFKPSYHKGMPVDVIVRDSVDITLSVEPI